MSNILQHLKLGISLHKSPFHHIKTLLTFASLSNRKVKTNNNPCALPIRSSGSKVSERRIGHETKQKQMSKQYETVFILTPVLSDEQTKEAVNAYKKLFRELGVKVVQEESWGLKKLAYQIKKKNTGFYQVFQIEAPGEAIAHIETAYKRDERVLRYLTIHLDKYALQYAERRKAKLANKKDSRKDRREEVAA